MVRVQPQIDLANYQSRDSDFAHLSLRNLIDARELFHIHLMRHPNVVATAIGRYRIRKDDSWPNDRPQRHDTGPRRLDNSEVRPYSWPCILVFVSQWEDSAQFASRPSDMVQKTVFMPDGSRVPICVVEAPKESSTAVEAKAFNHPINNIGPGSAIVAEVQGRQYVATVACLVSDGHKVFALTNRHVTGEAGEIVSSVLNGNLERIGVTAPKQLTRLPFASLYPNFSVQDTFVNLDVGLIDVDDVDRWTTKVRGIGTIGPMADFSSVNLSLSLVGCQVRGVGAASGEMLGEIHGLFYRYKTGGGFEYVADIYIGPRGSSTAEAPPPFATHPGDSGTMWLLEPAKPSPGKQGGDYLPLALQWGRNMLYSAERAPPQSFALATLMSRVCAMLEVDPVRDWNLDQTDTWGALGHFTIAARAAAALSQRVPRLKALMQNNATIISHDEAALKAGVFTGMGSQAFVPLADVPDFFWKPRVAKQGHARALEGSNHFADMDQPGPDGKTLLDLTKDLDNIDPDVWQAYYDSITDLLSGDPIRENRRGLLPFRVWQIFDHMCDFAAAGEAANYVCAAGVLAHYVADACQPLHISYLHDGDPLRPVEHVFSSGKRAGESEMRPLGQGIHSAYEDKMVFNNRTKILSELKVARVQKDELVASGRDAAIATVAMMRSVFKLMPPKKMVQTYVDVGQGGKAASDALWAAYGKKTIHAMQEGTHLLAVFWESAWIAGDGESNVNSDKALTKKQAMEIVKDPDFLPSVTIGKIGALLRRP